MGYSLKGTDFLFPLVADNFGDSLLGHYLVAICNDELTHKDLKTARANVLFQAGAQLLAKSTDFRGNNFSRVRVLVIQN